MGSLTRKPHDPLAVLTDDAREAAVRDLARIADANAGTIRPAAVVEAARPEEAPLHPAFEWNDAEAAEQYRLHQARSIIRVVKITTSTDPDHAARRVFVSVHEPDDAATSYVSAGRAATDPDLAKALLLRLIHEIEDMLARYAGVPKLRAVLLKARSELQDTPGPDLLPAPRPLADIDVAPIAVPSAPAPVRSLKADAIRAAVLRSLSIGDPRPFNVLFSVARDTLLEDGFRQGSSTTPILTVGELRVELDALMQEGAIGVSMAGTERCYRSRQPSPRPPSDAPGLQSSLSSVNV